MLVTRTQLGTNTILPAVKKTATKVASKTAEKLSEIRFLDIRPNKLVSEPYKDIFKQKCDGTGGGEWSGMSICEASWGSLC